MTAATELQRIPDKDLDFLRAYAARWRVGGRRTGVAHNRAAGLGVVVAALGCVHGLVWLGWTPLDAALLLYADMIVTLLVDALKFRLALPAVRRGLLHQAEDHRCWNVLLDLRLRGLIEADDIRRGRRVNINPIGKGEEPSPIDCMEVKPASMGCLYVLSIPIIVLFGLGLWHGLGSVEPDTLHATTDTYFLLWLAAAAALRLGDGLFLIQANRQDESRHDLLPGTGMGPGMLLLILPVTGIAAVIALPDQAHAFWMTLVVGYVFASLVMGRIYILIAWLRDRWLAAAVYVDQEGRLGRIGEVLTFRATGTTEPETEGDRGAAADQAARDAHALMLRNPDWASTTLKPDARLNQVFWAVTASASWVFLAITLIIALIWNLMAAWIAAVVLAGLALVLSGIWTHGRIQQRLFGQPLLVLDQAPVRLGELLSARLAAPIRTASATGTFEFNLACTFTRHISSSSGKLDSQHQKERLWEDRWEQSAERDADGAIEGVRLDRQVPEDLPESRQHSENGVSEQVEWKLKVRMRCSGMDFRATFELPVFHPDTGIEVRCSRLGVLTQHARSFAGWKSSASSRNSACVVTMNH